MNTIVQTGNDSALLKSYVSGDKAAINTLIERHRKRVYGYIMTIVRDSNLADDIFQETFIKVVASLDKGKYVDGGKFISWVLRIAHNQVIDHFRSIKGKYHVTSDDVGYDILGAQGHFETNAEDRLEGLETSEQVRSLVDNLPVEQREVVLMRHYMDLSFKEIAEQTGVSINTALGRMRYALINLRKLIESHNLPLQGAFTAS